MLLHFRNILAALALGGLAATSAAAQDIKVGLSLPENMEGFDFVNGMYETFKTEVEANSDMTVDLVYGNALGAPTDRLSQMRRGLIQMSDASDGVFAGIYPDMLILNMPYLFASEKKAWKVLDGPYGDKMAEDLREKTGIRALGWWESGGFKHFSANSPIHGPDDMKGLKIRVLGPLDAAPLEAMGASAVPIPFAELYTSLKTGVADGQYNSINVFKLVKLYEVQKYLTLSRHTYSFGPLGINDAFYSGLSDANRAVIDAAADTAIAFNRKTSRDTEGAALAFIKDHGVEVIQPTPEALAAFKAVMQPAAIEWLKGAVDTPARIDAAIAAADAAQ